MNNKNKYLILIVMLLSFFAFKTNALAKSNTLTYSLTKGTMNVYFNTGFLSSKKIVKAAVYCDNNQIFLQTMDNPVSEFETTFDISDRLTMGEHYCNIYYNYGDKNNNVSDTTKKVFSSDIYVNIMKPSDPNLNACSYVDANDYEKSCKSAGCYYENKTCTNYSDTSIPNYPKSDNNGTGSNGSGTGNGGFSGGGSGRGGSTSTGTDDVTGNVSGDKTPLDSSTFCKDISPGLKIAGYTIVIIKIITPLAIILMGSFDFYKAVSSGKAEDLKKQAIMLGNRVLVGVIIFFLPTILKTALNFISGDSEYITCIDCLFDPTKSCK